MSLRILISYFRIPPARSHRECATAVCFSSNDTKEFYERRFSIVCIEHEVVLRLNILKFDASIFEFSTCKKH